jgi:hypothetical protein
MTIDCGAGLQMPPSVEDFTICAVVLGTVWFSVTCGTKCRDADDDAGAGPHMPPSLEDLTVCAVIP